MLKFLFGILLLANGALFAYQMGYLEPLVPSGHEPARLANQLNANRVKLISASAATAASTPAVAATSVAMPSDSPAVTESKTDSALACTEIGNFDATEAKRFEVRLATLSLGKKLSRRNIQETANHMVYIPPQGGKDGADKKANELRHFGIKDFYVIQDDAELRWGISLGVFKSEEAARAYLDTLTQKGVHSARLGLHNVVSNKVVFQVRELDTGMKNNLDKIKLDFPSQEVRSCEASTPA